MPRLLLVAILWAWSGSPAAAEACRDAVAAIDAVLEEPSAGTGPTGQPGEVATEQPQYGDPQEELGASQASPALRDGEVAETQPQQGSERDAAAAAPSLRAGEVATEQPQYGGPQEDEAPEGGADPRQRLAELRDEAAALADQGREDECRALLRDAERLTRR